MWFNNRLTVILKYFNSGGNTNEKVLNINFKGKKKAIKKIKIRFM
jgi:hypothetical protein